MEEAPLLKPVPGTDLLELCKPHQWGAGLYIPAGFRYNGANIPFFAWKLTYTPHHPKILRGSLIHDWLYYCHLTGRELADDLLLGALVNDGANRIKASTIHRAVRIFGGRYWKNGQADFDEIDRLLGDPRNTGLNPNDFSISHKTIENQ
jgi:hypothetical protein